MEGCQPCLAAATQAYQPGQAYWDMFWVDVTSAALEEDAKPSVHALSLGQRVRTRAQIENMYDGIS
eukprot:81569-Chlamydomonas_euryale.AAC.2